MTIKFDVFFACAPKDFNKIPYTIKSFIDNVEGYGNIIICSPIDLPPYITSQIPIMYYTYLDENCLPGVNREGWRFRPNWCFQQHLKLFQTATSDWYLTFDCDNIVNRPMRFFTEKDKPIYYRGIDQHYPPYFSFMNCMLNLEKVSPRSYIADMNLINRDIIKDMLARNGYTIDSFIKRSQDITNRNCHIGEPELYGNYCKKFYPTLYIEKDLQQAPFIGRHQENVGDNVYLKEEIEDKIEEMKQHPYDVFSLHSWLNEGNED